MTKNKHGLKFSSVARDDLDQIFSYISGELCAEQAANNLMERIETRIMRLKDYPFSGNCVVDEFLKNKGYRMLIIDNYVAFYLVDEFKKWVVIMRVLYGSQKYQDIL